MSALAHITGLLARLLRKQDGATVIEFSMVLPIFLVTVLGIIVSGRALWTQAALHYAVEEAARCMTINTATCGTTLDIQRYASQSAGLGFSDADAAAVFTPAPNLACGNQVAASYAFQMFGPLSAVGKSFYAGVLPTQMTLTAQSCFPK